MAEMPHDAPDLAGWYALMAAARRRGEFLEVIDLARKGLLAFPGDLRLEYDKTLAYARAGATSEAEANLLLLRETGALDVEADRDLLIDFAALSARVLKDRAYNAPHELAPPLAAEAAAAYEAVFLATGAYFPAINAATLYRFAGDTVRSEGLARAALADAQAAPPGYWAAATAAEAHILLGQYAEAEAGLRSAMAADIHLDELASTRRQLEWLLDYGAGNPTVLAALPAPTIVIWDSAATLGAVDLAEIGAFVQSRPADRQPVLAYGAIVGAADIAVSEAFIATGARIHLVIACVASACIAAVAEQFGPDWASRLQAVMAGAASVSEVTLEGTPTEHTVATMARQQASGLALMRATALVTTVHKLRLGGTVTISGDDAPPPDGQDRVARAFVFGDVKGFSTIPEAAHRPFLDYVIGGFADVLAELGAEVEYAETAGDGIFVVLASIVSALRCCDGLQRVMEPERVAEAGLPASLALRLGAHIGPAARGLDRVTGRHKFIGKEVIRTARIEAVTPVGRTYVTEQFAATLHASSPVGHACEYVGWQAMAKGFGHCRMYSLRPTPQTLAMLAG